MALEVIYKKMHSVKFKVLEYWAVYVVSVVMNCVGDESVLSGRRSYIEMLTDLGNSAVVILIILTLVVIVFYILYFLLRYYSLRQNFSAEFTRIMRAHSEGINQNRICGGVSWGQNRTLWTAPNLIMGLESQNVVIADYDDTPYVFPSDLAQEFADYEKSEYLTNIRSLGNDLPRYMLSKYGANVDKVRPILTLQLKKTSWGACQFVWNRFVGCGDKEVRQARQKEWCGNIVQEHLDSGLRVARYPNSLCLHLVIETVDGNVIITSISKDKSNDYPSTKAVSIGEQLDLADFIDVNDFRKNFVNEWVRRSICEEFGLSESQYDDEFTESSIRVLALDMEQDIYNFALVTTIKMKHDCEYFKSVVNATIDHKEISDMTELSLSSIPEILMNYNKNRNEYHPSSYLRLLLFYLYKNGYRRTCKDFSELNLQV